jgi:hypothetical protein
MRTRPTRIKRLHNAIAGIAVMLVLVSVTTGQTARSGDILEEIESIRNAMPGMGSNGFDIPSTAQLNDFSAIISNLKNLNLSPVSGQLSPYGYEFIRFFDVASAETLLMFKESIPVGRGWGTIIFNPSGAADITIEVPHPVWDTKSWRLGIISFLRTHSRWFVMAGTHRYANVDSSSDMAHVTQSVFHRAHQVIATPVSIQIHGFGKSDPVYNGYPDVVISSGQLYPSSIYFTLQSNYEDQGFSAGVYSFSTQSTLWRLGATTNKQGQWSNANGKTFIHIEHDTPIRTDSAKTAKVAGLLAATFGVSAMENGDNDVSLPDRDCSLLPNYPNPFNPVTTIPFTLRQRTTVTVKVFDLLGREVAVLLNESRPAGAHAVSWSAEGLRAGVYYCSIVTRTGSITRSMMYLP